MPATSLTLAGVHGAGTSRLGAEVGRTHLTRLRIGHGAVAADGAGGDARRRDERARRTVHCKSESA